MPPFKIIVWIMCSVLLVACDESNDDTTVDIESCEVTQQNRAVHEVLLDKYLWYQDIDQTLDYSSLDSPQQTLEFLIDRDRDRFSGIDNAADFDSLFQEGQYLGYGFSFTIKADGRVWIQFVYNDSPAGKSSIKRGDEILSINGQTVQQVIDSLSWDTVFGPALQNHPLTMQLRNQLGNIFSVILFKTTVNINTVLHHGILHNGSENVGYLAYKSFLNTSNAEFPAVFAAFKAAGVRKVILDMRYNGGGSVSVANKLASYLYANETTDDDLFTKLIYNDKHQDSNVFFFLESSLNQLELDQLIVITSAATCSASEMIINGLKPYVDVKTVGSATCGKPVGMNGFRFCDNIFLPVTFESQNKNDEGGYFDGISADCAAADDVNFALGDAEESMLSEALFVSANNRCQSALRVDQAERPDRKLEPVLRAVIGAY